MNYKIIPNPPVLGQSTAAQGTRVLDSEGKELERVFRVELLADCMSVWKAVIHVHATVADVIQAEGIVEPHYIECGEEQAMRVVNALVQSVPGSVERKTDMLEAMRLMVASAYSERNA